MIVYMHCDNTSRVTAFGFKSSRSAANYVSGRVSELASYVKRRLPDGSIQDVISKQTLIDIEKGIASSAKGNVETTVIALQKAIDLYEAFTGNTSKCHIVEEVNIVS
jgi:hypothetical protein